MTIKKTRLSEDEVYQIDKLEIILNGVSNITYQKFNKITKLAEVIDEPTPDETE
jgi:hypothetical protein